MGEVWDHLRQSERSARATRKDKPKKSTPGRNFMDSFAHSAQKSSRRQTEMIRTPRMSIKANSKLNRLTTKSKSKAKKSSNPTSESDIRTETSQSNKGSEMLNPTTVSLDHFHDFFDNPITLRKIPEE